MIFLTNYEYFTKKVKYKNFIKQFQAGVPNLSGFPIFCKNIILNGKEKINYEMLIICSQILSISFVMHANLWGCPHGH